MNALLVLTVLVAALGNAASSDVIELTDKNFKDIVLNSELPFMVEFFAPWCGHCKALTPEWDKAATNLKGIVPVGKVDCTVHQQLCGKYEVKGYPTIKCFSEKGKKVVDYQQARQASAIIQFATNQLTDKIARVKDADSLKKYLDKSPEQVHVILFTAKAEVSPLFKALAVKYHERILFAQVKKGVTAIEQKYNVQQFPTILAISGENVQTFDGTVSSESLTTWLGGMVGDEVPPTTQEEAPKPKPKAKPKIVETSFAEAKADNLNELCSTAGLCIVGFVDATTSGEARSVNPEQNAVLTNVLNKWSKDGKFKFVWVDRASAGDLGKKFSISAAGPSLVVYNAKRSKFALSEGFTEADAHRLLEHVNAGDVKYQQL